MEDLKTNAVEYGPNKIKTLLDSASEKLIDASFRESVIPEIEARKQKIVIMLEEQQKIKAELDEKDNDPKVKHSKEHREAKKVNERKLGFYQRSVEQDDNVIAKIQDHAENLRAEADLALLQAKFIKEHFPTDVLADFEKFKTVPEKAAPVDAVAKDIEE